MNNDLISREALKEDFKSRLAFCNEWIEKAKDKETKIRASAVKAFIGEVIMTINNAPTVDLFCSYLSDGEVRQPCVEGPCEQAISQGEWVTEYDRLKCPFCGMSIDDEVHWLYSEEYNFNFCPNCGAKMKGGAE